MSTYEPVPSDELELKPYAAPSARIDGQVVELTDAEAETIRREHIKREASVKSIGSLHILVAIFGVCGIIFLVTRAILGMPKPELRVIYLGIAGFYVLMTALNIALGLGLRKLQPWARWTETALLSLGVVYMLATVILQAAMGTIRAMILFGYEIVGLFCGYILYLLLSAKGSMVFSERYKAIIAQTPHVKYRVVVLLVKIVVVLFVCFIFRVVASAVIGLFVRR